MSIKRFTMVELLLTIAIILVLMGIAIPIYGTARNAVVRSRASRGAFDLRNAIAAYQKDYTVVPLNDVFTKRANKNGDLILNASEYTDVIKILRNSGRVVDNPRKIVYLEHSATDQTHEHKCPLVANYQDPSMGNNEARYLVILNLKGNPIQVRGQNFETDILVIGLNPKDLSPNYNDMSDIKWRNPQNDIDGEDWEIMKEKAVFTSAF